MGEIRHTGDIIDGIGGCTAGSMSGASYIDSVGTMQNGVDGNLGVGSRSEELDGT